MAGASFSHTLVVLNVGGELRSQLKGKLCRVSSSDLRVRTGDAGLYTYPDVLVVCGQPDLEQPREWIYALENGLDASVKLSSIGCELKLSEVYGKVEGLREPWTYYR